MFMDRWHAFGNLIGSKMPLIVPCCVAAGVLLPQVFSPIRTVVPVMFAFMTFQGSLNNTVHQLVGVFKHPKDLIVILLISQVFMPTLAYFLASLLFAGNVNLITGILLEYSVPVAVVSFMWVGMFHGDGPLGLAVILVSTVLAPFSIPLTLQILMGHSIQIDAAKMIFDMVLMIALPALAGMMVNELTHGWGHERLSPAISPIRAKFKSSLIRAVASRAQNRRGYKRILSPADVATILQETCCDIPAGNPDEWVEEALREFRDSFSVAGELCLDAEAFQRLEWVPFLAGVGVIRDYLRDEAFQPLLFGNPGFPECPFAPPAGEFINQRQERETQEVETDLVPTTTMAKEFVEKLEGIVDAHAELRMQREVYMSLIRRVKSHFDCLGVCWR